MRKTRFHFFKQYHRGDNKEPQEIDQKEFIKLLGENYCYDTTTCGMLEISIANYKKAGKIVASLKRSNLDVSIYSCGPITLSFRQERKKTLQRRWRDARYPD